jgi:hypothetical protein
MTRAGKICWKRSSHQYDEAGIGVGGEQARVPEGSQIIVVAAAFPDLPGKHAAIALSQLGWPGRGRRRSKTGRAEEGLKICPHHAVMLRRLIDTPKVLFVELAQQQSLCLRQGSQHGGCQFPRQEQQGAATGKVMQLLARQFRPGWFFQNAVAQEPVRP